MRFIPFASPMRTTFDNPATPVPVMSQVRREDAAMRALWTHRATRSGGGHCGQVRFECTSDLATVTAWNCSICTKKGLHFTFLPPQSFQLRAGRDNLDEHLFNKHAIQHQLCIDCGVDVFARGEKPDGAEVVALGATEHRDALS